MSEKFPPVFVIIIDGRFFYGIKNNRVRTAWSLTAAKFFVPDSHYQGAKSPSNIEYVKSQLDAKGKKYQILTVKLQLPETETVIPLESIPKAESQSDSFICKGCNHLLNNSFIMRTDGFCYMCDPEVTLAELLSDEPIPDKQKTYLFPTDILI